MAILINLFTSNLLYDNIIKRIESSWRMKMFNIVSLIFKYIFIIIIYLFILSIIRLIYLDIKGIDTKALNNASYLKLVNRKDTLPFKVKEYYPLDKEVYLGRGKDNQIVIRDPYISKGI